GTCTDMADAAPFPTAPSPVLARILGFCVQDYLPSVDDPLWVAPTSFNLDYPSFLLLTVAAPTGDYPTENPSGADNRTIILARISLYPQWRMERGVPMSLPLPGLKVLNRVRLALLNPDRTPYQLHGREWSLTLGGAT